MADSPLDPKGRNGQDSNRLEVPTAVVIASAISALAFYLLAAGQMH